MAELLNVKSEEASTQINSTTEFISNQEVVQKATQRPEWLPDGWTVDVKTRRSGALMGSGYKCYIDPLKGYKFYSKPEVLRYLEIIKGNSCTPKKAKRESRCTPKKGKNRKSCSPVEEKKEDSLPPVEERKEDSLTPVEERKEDSFTPIEEKKEDSSPKEEKKDGNCTTKEDKKDNNCTPKKEKKESPINVVVKKSAAEGLPPGWIKELRIKTRVNGSIREDLYYKEPVSGYVFRSKKEVQRYLESGHKPRRKQLQDGDKLSPSCAAKTQILDQSAPKQEPFTSKEIFDKNSLDLSDADSSRKGQDVNVHPDMMVASAPQGESVVKMHSAEDGAENLPEMKKISNPDEMPDKEHVGNMMGSANEKKHSTPSKSKKKEFNVPHRFSPRLAGIEPVQLTNIVTNKQNPQVPKRNLRKKRTTVDADLENKSAHHVNSVPETEHVHKMQEVVTNTINNLFEDQIVSEEKPNKLETDKTEHAHKMKEVVINTINNLFEDQIVAEEKPNLLETDKTEHAHKMQEVVINTINNLFEDQIVTKEKPNKLETDKIDDKKPEMHTNSNRSYSKRDHHIHRRTSKRLAGIDHELMNNSISYQKIPEYESKRNEINAELQQSEGGPAIELANHAPINGESANRRHETSKIPPISDGQPENLQSEEIVDKKSEPQVSFACHYSCPNPSLEHAINTLTSVLPVEDSVDTGPTKVPQTNIENKLFENVSGRSRDENDPQVRSNKSKKRKGLKVPTRVSKRLAGLEPDLRPSERAVEYANKRSCKEQSTATVTTTESLTNGAPPDHLDAEEETKVTYHASHFLKTEVPGESSKKSDKSYDAQTVPTEQLQKVEAENIGDERSEPQLPEPYGESWSDPCLEYAFKTFTGGLPFDAAADIFPVLTPGVNDLPNKESHQCVVTSISEEAHINLNQSQNKKESDIVDQPSKPLSRQPELRTDYTTSYDNAPNFIIRNYYGDEGFLTRTSDGAATCVDAGNGTQLVHHSRDMNTLIHNEPLKENRQVLHGESVITEQQQPESETINCDNSESQFCASFMNSWSDPCLDFAFKTLTGVIPLDENLPFQGSFQQPVNCHNQNIGSSMLPDLGNLMIPDFGPPPGFSQSDFPFHYDVGVNSIPRQQSSISTPFLPVENATSLQDFPEIHPQKQYSQCNKNFQR